MSNQEFVLLVEKQCDNAELRNIISTNKDNRDLLKLVLLWQKIPPHLVKKFWYIFCGGDDDDMFEELSQNFAGRWETFPPELVKEMAPEAYLGWRRFLDRPQDFCAEYLRFQIAPRGFLPAAQNVEDFVVYQNIKHVLFNDDWANMDVYQILRRLGRDSCPEMFSLVYEFHDVPNPLAPFNKLALDARFFDWMAQYHRMQTMPLELLDNEYFAAWFRIESFFENGGFCEEFLERFMRKIDAANPPLNLPLLLQHFENICTFQQISEDFVIRWREYDLIKLASGHVKFSRKILPYWKHVSWQVYFKHNLTCSDELIEAMITPQMVPKSGYNKVKICKYFAANPRKWSVGKWNKDYCIAPVTCDMSPLAKIAMTNYLSVSNRYPENFVRISHREMVTNLKLMIKNNCVKIGALTREILATRADLVLRACKFCSLSDDVIWRILEFFGIDAQFFTDNIPPMWEQCADKNGFSVAQKICHELLARQILPPQFVTSVLSKLASKQHDWKLMAFSLDCNFLAEHVEIVMQSGKLLNVLNCGNVSVEFVDHVVEHHLPWLIENAKMLRQVPYLFSREQVVQIFGTWASGAELQNLCWNYGAPFEEPIDAEGFDPERVLYYTGEQAVQVAAQFASLGAEKIQHLILATNLVDDQYLDLVRRFGAATIAECKSPKLDNLPRTFEQFFPDMDLYINNTFSPEFLRRNPTLVNWNSFFGFSPCVTIDLVRDFVNPSRDDCFAIINNRQLSDAFKQECIATWPQFMWPKVWCPR